MLATEESVQVETVAAAVKNDRRFISAARVAAKQRTHFIFWTVLPFLACVVWFVMYPVVTPIDALLLIGMWTLTGGLGISIGYHRYYTHGAFQAHPILQTAMAAAGSLAAQGPVTYWVSVHRCHHKHSDAEHDPHSPAVMTENATLWSRISAFFHGHMGWVVKHDVPSPIVFARDLMKSPVVRFFDKTYWRWVVAGVVVPGALMLIVDPTIHGFLRGCIFGGLLRILVGNQIIWAINSVCHAHGSHVYDTSDSSTNNLLLALPAFGEGWHNNHHAFPWSAKFGLKWWQIDVGWTALRCLAFVGLASNLKSPTVAQLENRATAEPQIAAAADELPAITITSSNDRLSA